MGLLIRECSKNIYMSKILIKIAIFVCVCVYLLECMSVPYIQHCFFSVPL